MGHPGVVVGGGEQTTAKTKADPCGMTTKGQATARATAKTKAVDEELKEKKRGSASLLLFGNQAEERLC
jgi:hypothetical protein